MMNVQAYTPQESKQPCFNWRHHFPESSQVGLCQEYNKMIDGFLGISFFIVAWFSICNKILTKWIVQNGTQEEWGIVFFVSSGVAFLPVIVFSLWGSNERQWWAAPSSRASVNNLSRQHSQQSKTSFRSWSTMKSSNALFTK